MLKLTLDASLDELRKARPEKNTQALSNQVTLLLLRENVKESWISEKTN